MSPVLISDLLAKAAESTFRPVRPSQLVGKLVNPIREVVSKINLSGSVVDGKSFLNLGLGKTAFLSDCQENDDAS